jgi:hypothetical protein
LEFVFKRVNIAQLRRVKRAAVYVHRGRAGRVGASSRRELFSKKVPHPASEREVGRYTDLTFPDACKSDEGRRWCERLSLLAR